MKDRLADYEEVPERIVRFIEKYPDGSLVRDEWHFETVGEQTFIVYTAKAFRTKADVRPGVGTAWEPFPGKTAFTKDSELMNAETSAWGRALVAIGFVGKKSANAKPKIASKNEVQARQPDPKDKPKDSISTKDAETLREAVVASGIDLNEVQVKLTALGAGKLDDLTQKQADELFDWVQEQTAEKAAA